MLVHMKIKETKVIVELKQFKKILKYTPSVCFLIIILKYWCF